MKSIFIRGREFRAIPGLRDYFVSKHGSIASTSPRCYGDHDKPRRDLRRPYIKKLNFYIRKSEKHKSPRRRAGYFVFTQHRIGNRKHMLVHHAVLLAWVGPRPPGAMGRHLDGLTRRNHVENLAWGTHAENQADAALHRSRAGHRNGAAKMTAQFVFNLRVKARRRIKRGKPWLRYLVEAHPQYSQFALWAATTGYTWEHLAGAVQTNRTCSKQKWRSSRL